jgi:hypothetical protein
MKTKSISKILLSLCLVFMLGSAITQVHGQVVTIQSAGDVIRGQTGLFILTMNPPPPPDGGTYVNFSVSGTAIPGVDYVPLISPAYIPGCSGNFCVPGVGLIAVKTLPDPRGSADRKAYSVVVTLKPGLGYAVGQPGSAQMMINPSP